MYIPGKGEHIARWLEKLNPKTLATDREWVEGEVPDFKIDQINIAVVIGGKRYARVYEVPMLRLVQQKPIFSL